MVDRFDHVVIAVHDLDEAVACYRRLGFAVSLGGRHIGHGTRNAIIRFGLDYLELLALDDEAPGGATALGGPPLVEFLSKHKGGLVGYALATSEIEQVAERFRHAGDADVAPVGPFSMQRQRPDGRLLSWRLLFPGGVPWRRPWPFLIQWDSPDDERLAWEPPAVHPNGVIGVASIALVVANLDAAANLYQQQLGLAPGLQASVRERAAEGITYRVGGCTIEVLAPTGTGVVQQALEDAGEGPFEVTLAIGDLERTQRVLEAGGSTPELLPGSMATLRLPPNQAYGACLAFV